jgi:mutator protein MutT
MQQSNKLHVTLLFLLNGDQVLLAMKKRGFGAGLYNGVGGKLDPGETVEQAAVRECQEEVTVTPRHIQKVAQLNFVFAESKPPQPDMYVTTFITSEWDGEPNETEEMSPKWFKQADIPYKDMWEDDPHWLPQVLEGKKVVGDFSFNLQNKLIRHDVRVVDQL